MKSQVSVVLMSLVPKYVKNNYSVTHLWHALLVLVLMRQILQHGFYLVYKQKLTSVDSGGLMKVSSPLLDVPFISSPFRTMLS